MCVCVWGGGGGGGGGGYIVVRGDKESGEGSDRPDRQVATRDGTTRKQLTAQLWVQKEYAYTAQTNEPVAALRHWSCTQRPMHLAGHNSTIMNARQIFERQCPVPGG